MTPRAAAPCELWLECRFIIGGRAIAPPLPAPPADGVLDEVTEGIAAATVELEVVSFVFDSVGCVASVGEVEDTAGDGMAIT